MDSEGNKFDRFVAYFCGRSGDLSPGERAQFEDAARELRERLNGGTMFTPEEHEYFRSLVPPLPEEDEE
jgi:hypothetical protein